MHVSILLVMRLLLVDNWKSASLASFCNIGIGHKFGDNLTDPDGTVYIKRRPEIHQTSVSKKNFFCQINVEFRKISTIISISQHVNYNQIIGKTPYR